MIGSILHDAEGHPLSFFSGCIPSRVLDQLYLTSDRSIYEVELLASWAAISVWWDVLQDSYFCFYLGNEATKVTHFWQTIH